MYTKITLNGDYFITRGLYFFFIPIAVPCKKIYSLARAAGFQPKEPNDAGPILESARKFGYGWIGVEVTVPTKDRSEIKYLEGNFEAYEFTGPYQKLGHAYKYVAKDHPNKTEFLNLYLDDPRIIPADKCRTLILFR